MPCAHVRIWSVDFADIARITDTLHTTIYTQGTPAWDRVFHAKHVTNLKNKKACYPHLAKLLLGWVQY